MNDRDPALDDGRRESTESSLDLLRGCKRRGMAAPVLAVGTVPWGSGPRSARCSPETREQRCWWNKIGNVLNALPKSAQPGVENVGRGVLVLGVPDLGERLWFGRRMRRTDLPEARPSGR